MGATAALNPARLTVLPGSSAVVAVQVRNTGTLVDEMGFEVLGDAAGWALVEPATLALYPGATGEVRLTFSPPRDSALAPVSIPFGLRVQSREDATGSVVEEGVLDVGAFSDLSVELLPRTSRGRGWGKHEIAIDNRGNTSVEVALAAAEGQDRTELNITEPAAVVGPGQAAFVAMRVRGIKRIWKGVGTTHPVAVVADPGDGTPPLVAEGSFLQEATIPRWLPKLIAALIALALLAVLLWFTLLKPAVKDAAKDQAKQTAQTAGAAAGAAAGKKAAAGAGGGGAASPSPSTGGGPTSPTPTASSPSPAGTTTTTALGDPTFTRLVATAGQQAPQATFDPRSVLSVTDIVFENPNGDTGLITLSCGTEVLFTPSLANFRDFDTHLVAPIECGPGQPLIAKVTCDTPGVGASCTPSVSISGFLRKVSASPSPAASP